ncbi:hypothetical protein FC15_GL001347 [Lapidilactobacillus concavus DSM 17758]|uniref:Uncharacterized protein n=1 Tax=Lapidilactobacillus concavus DSM 17758 TaxID=1423735 RepID=A0A0R1W4U4_9LACO|nr:hypothetical protein FC15_GL001347 [Lapidilactobacillus concavus DSM 17758]GEL13408.1 hypothetical protein LCO01nite_09570 [Lapidilactobacillus concavus]
MGGQRFLSIAGQPVHDDAKGDQQDVDEYDQHEQHRQNGQHLDPPRPGQEHSYEIINRFHPRLA